MHHKSTEVDMQYLGDFSFMGIYLDTWQVCIGIMALLAVLALLVGLVAFRAIHPQRVLEQCHSDW